MKFLLFFLATLGVAAGLDITVSPHQFMPLMTPKITVRCDQNDPIKTVFSLSIFHEQSGNKTFLVDISAMSGTISLAASYTSRAKATGTLAQGTARYLELTIDKPTAADEGKYICSFTGMTQNHQTITIENQTSVSALDYSSIVTSFQQLQQEVQDLKNRSCDCTIQPEVNATVPVQSTPEIVGWAVRMFNTTGEIATITTDNIIPWTLTEVDTHNALDPATHEFEVPVSGYYRVELTLTGANPFSNSRGHEISVNVNNLPVVQMLAKNDITSSTSAVVKLIKNQIVTVVAGRYTKFKTDRFSYFSAFLFGKI